MCVLCGYKMFVSVFNLEVIRTTCHSVGGIGMIIDKNNVQNSVGFGGE